MSLQNNTTFSRSAGYTVYTVWAGESGKGHCLFFGGIHFGWGEDGIDTFWRDGFDGVAGLVVA